jgi:hypothetical protein
MKNIMQEKQIQKKSKYLKILFFLIISIVILVFWLIYFHYPPGWDFRNNLYLPTYLLIQQLSPYNIHGLVEGSNAVWLPMVIGIFLPLGYLDLQQASNFWWLLNFTSLLVLVWIATQQQKPHLLKLLLTIVWIFLFPSSISNFNLGQISILICLAMLLVLRFYYRFPNWITGLLLTFSMIKPQLSVFFIPAYHLHIWKIKGWKALLILAGWTLTGLILTLLPLMILYPEWLPDFFTNLMDNPCWAHPSIYNLINLISGVNAKEFGWLFFMGGLMLSLLIVNKSYYGIQTGELDEISKRVERAFLWVLAITTIFSPYIWSWDFVLLYPLIVSQIFKEQNPVKTILFFVGLYTIWGIYFYQKFAGQINDFQYWWIPYALLLLLAAVKAFPINETKE